MTAPRRFTKDGIETFAQFITRLELEPGSAPPRELLTDPGKSESLGVDCSLPAGGFASRWEIAKALFACFAPVGLTDCDRDEGLWSWLACHYFDEICPPDGNGNRDVGEHPRYVLEANNWRRYYRHLLAGPYRLFKANRDKPERCRALLLGAPDTPGELYEQIAAQQLLISNRNFVEMVTGLYLDPSTGRLKRGAGGSGPGSPRRLSLVSRQFDLTYDFETLGPNEIAALLPKEFERYRRTTIE